jgi:predicted Zn-dependent protease
MNDALRVFAALSGQPLLKGRVARDALVPPADHELSHALSRHGHGQEEENSSVSLRSGSDRG